METQQRKLCEVQDEASWLLVLQERKEVTGKRMGGEEGSDKEEGRGRK